MAQVNPFGTRQTINPNISNQAKRPYRTPIQDTHFSTPHEIEIESGRVPPISGFQRLRELPAQADDLEEFKGVNAPLGTVNQPSPYPSVPSGVNVDLLPNTELVNNQNASPLMDVNNPQQRNVTQNAGSVEGDFPPETDIMADIQNWLSTLGGRPESAPTMGDGSSVPIHGIRNDQTPAEHLDEYGKLIDVNEPLRAANNLNTNRITSSQSEYDPLNLTGETGKVEATAANTKDFEKTKELQTNLNAEHGANLVVDGIMGPKTRAAMEAAQQGTSTNPFPFEDPTWSSTASNPLSTTDESGTIIDPNKGMRGSGDPEAEAISTVVPEPPLSNQVKTRANINTLPNEDPNGLIRYLVKKLLSGTNDQATTNIRANPAGK